MDTELKPCPFCGGRAKLISYYGFGYVVICEECDITTKYYPLIDEAIKFWNRRNNDTKVISDNTDNT